MSSLKLICSKLRVNVQYRCFILTKCCLVYWCYQEVQIGQQTWSHSGENLCFFTVLLLSVGLREDCLGSYEIWSFWWWWFEDETVLLSHRYSFQENLLLFVLSWLDRRSVTMPTYVSLFFRRGFFLFIWSRVSVPLVNITPIFTLILAQFLVSTNF